MPTTVNVLSWNVESIGVAKVFTNGAQRSKLVKFLQYVIQLSNADLVGIMELKGGVGGQLRDWLLAKLNNARPGPPFAYTWRARLSSRQDGGTQEEYLLLWKDQPNRLTLDATAMPGPTWLAGVVDDNALETFFGQFAGWGAAEKANLVAALTSCGYTVKGFYRARNAPVPTVTNRVGPTQWQALQTAVAPAAVDFAGAVPAPPAGIDAGQLQQLARILLAIDILRFPTYAERSPFFGSFLIGNPAQPLTVGLLHAPGPSDPVRTDAINIMALSQPLVAAPSLLLMGDFNIAANHLNLQARVYSRSTDANGQFGFRPVVPAQRQQVFGPVAGAPLNAPDQIGNNKTSLVNAYLADNAPIADALANTYDKFFFRGTAQLVSANPAVLAPIVAMASNQAAYDPNLGTAGLTYFRTFRGAAFVTQQSGNLNARLNKLNRLIAAQQGIIDTASRNIAKLPPGQVNKRNALMNRRQTATARRDVLQRQQQEITAELAALTVLLALVNAAAAPSPTGIGTSHAVYRYAVSDHLPILIQLTAA